jgi:hypothetical protein
MPLDPKSVLGMYVRLLPGAYIRNSIPARNWTGTIEAVRQTEMDQPGEYLFHIDELFREDKKDFYVLEHEIEPCERPKP